MAQIDVQKVGQGVLVSVITAVIAVVALDHDRITEYAAHLDRVDEKVSRMERNCQRRVSEIERIATANTGYSRAESDRLQIRITRLEDRILDHEKGKE